MKISELIEHLEKLKAEHGDLPVYRTVQDGMYEEEVNADSIWIDIGRPKGLIGDGPLPDRITID